MIKPVKPDIETRYVMLITDDKRSRDRDVVEVVQAALSGGVRCVQFRPWKPSDGEFLKKARKLRSVTRQAGALLIINDRIDIASLCQADGVHLGAGDIPIPDARRLLGDFGLIGYSAHSMDEAAKAAGDGADYVTLSPVFDTTSTSFPRTPIGPFEVLEADCAVHVPVFALGGIDHGNVSQLLDIGVERVAVVSCITRAEDVEAAARSLCALVQSPVA